MQISLLLALQILKLFAIMLMGYAIVKLGLLKASDSKALSVVLVYLIMPCVIINVFLPSITPACATITSMAQLYDRDAAYASSLYVLTTLLSIFTMPCMVFLYETLI